MSNCFECDIWVKCKGDFHFAKLLYSFDHEQNDPFTLSLSPVSAYLFNPNRQISSICYRMQKTPSYAPNTHKLQTKHFNREKTFDELRKCDELTQFQQMHCHHCLHLSVLCARSQFESNTVHISVSPETQTNGVVLRLMYECVRAHIQLTADKMQNEFLYFTFNRHIDPNKIGSGREKKVQKIWSVESQQQHTFVDKTNSHVH